MIVPAARAAALGLLSALALLLGAGAARADHTQLSIFQDDQYLLYSKASVVEHTVQRLKALGVQELRVTVKWSSIAPGAGYRAFPAKPFTAYDPSTYPQSNWAPYDRIDELAAKAGIPVLFTLTGPGPLWATATRPPTGVAANHWYLNAYDFALFVYAVGARYSGHYDGLPAVTHWSIWNEPDQPGWLAPQTLKRDGHVVAVAPRLYRGYVDGAWAALTLSGHAVPANTILIGELAPEGDATTGSYTPMTPMPFMRDLYCVNTHYRPLTGAAATALGCPTTRAARQAFAAANPALFQASGFAHHPYYFNQAPAYRASDPDWVPLADIGRLEHGLDRALAAWGVHRRLPIYFTEYGYQTKPPDPYQTVTPAEQAGYLNQADYLAWRNPRVRSVAQFELYDSPPNPLYKPGQYDYWDTFQTGLLFANGRPKPALAAYRLPIWISSARFSRGSTVAIWGQVRPESGGGAATAQVQWHGASGAWRTLSEVTTRGHSGYYLARVKPPGSGAIRILWHGASSRDVPVTAR